MNLVRTLLALMILSAGTLLAQTPVITGIFNNYNRIPQTSSQGYIAQGSIFIVQGSNLSDKTTGLQDVFAGDLKTTLEGVRIRVNVGTRTLYAPLYYVLPDQLAGIMPSTMSIGTGNIVVENNGRNSGPSMVRVLNRGLGILNYDTAPLKNHGIVQDSDYALLGPTNATNPGRAIIFYGSGLGPVRAGVNESALQVGVNASGNMTAVRFDVRIGSKPATVEYGGRSIYPGLDQINIRVPVLEPGDYGCDVPVFISSDGIDGNTVTIPVAATGNTCEPIPSGGLSNPYTLPQASEIGAWIEGNYFRSGTISFSRTVNRNWRFVDYFVRSPIITETQSTGLNVSFGERSGNGYEQYLLYLFSPRDADPSPGTCVVYTPAPSQNFGGLAGKNVDAGAWVVIAGPSGSLALRRNSNLTYNTPPLLTGPYAEGRYVFRGTGGVDVDPFTGFLDIGPEFVVTNPGDFELTIQRDQGMTVHWTGGGAAMVEITGSSQGLGGAAGLTFTCQERASAGKLTIPAAILTQLAPTVMNGENAVSGALLAIKAKGPDNRMMNTPHLVNLLTATYISTWNFTPQYK